MDVKYSWPSYPFRLRLIERSRLKKHGSLFQCFHIYLLRPPKSDGEFSIFVLTLESCSSNVIAALKICSETEASSIVDCGGAPFWGLFCPPSASSLPRTFVLPKGVLLLQFLEKQLSLTEKYSLHPLGDCEVTTRRGGGGTRDREHSNESLDFS